MENKFVRKPRNREVRPKMKTIEELYQNGMKQKDIGKMFGWSQPGISELMKHYNIQTRKKKQWSKNEEKLLRKYYLKKPKDNLLKIFSDRNWRAIKLKAHFMGLSMNATEYRKSDEVRNRLRELSKKRMIKINYKRKKDIAYILGVIDGDGYTDKKSTIGLETISLEFIKKFMKGLKIIGINPNYCARKERKQWVSWGCSKQFVDWYSSLTPKKKSIYLKRNDTIWRYIEGLYDSDGALHPCGCPQICGYNIEKNKFVGDLLTYLNIENTVHKDKVWIRARSTKDFFKNVKCVIDKRNPK